MIIIWGHKTQKYPSPDSDSILGPSRKCPRRNCGGECRLYTLKRYCHVYWIPCFPTGAERQIVQCLQCQAMFDKQEYLQLQKSVSTAVVNVGIQALLRQGRFELAEKMAREILKKEPMNINAMIQLDVALNGLGRLQDSDRLESQIMFHWQQHCRDKWIEDRRPQDKSTFLRVILADGLAKYFVEAKQYFEPEPVGEVWEVPMYALYKILANPLEQSSTGATETFLAPEKRLFKLLRVQDKQIGTLYVLVEVLPDGTRKDVITYESSMQPDIRKVSADVAYILGAPDINRQLPLANVPATLEEILDGHVDFQYFSACEYDQKRNSILKNAVANYDWRTIRDLFKTFPQDGRSFWMGVVADEIEKTWPKTGVDMNGIMSPMLDAWLAAEPDSADCRLIRLRTYSSWAWNARTAALAMRVSKERSLVFHKRLTAASNEFSVAREICPTDPLLYSFAVPMIKGLGERVASTITMEQCLAELRDKTNDPLCYSAHIGALQYYCSKWYGSHEKMFQYVQSVTSQLPDGHALWVLVPMAHWERVLLEKPESQKGYWQRPDVVQEIGNAYKRAFPEGSKTMATAKAPHVLSMEWKSRNYFAYCLIMTQQHEEARRQIRVIGKCPIPMHPWHNISGYKYFLGMLGFENEDSTVPLAPATVHTSEATVSDATPLVEATPIIPAIV